MGGDSTPEMINVPSYFLLCFRFFSASSPLQIVSSSVMPPPPPPSIITSSSISHLSAPSTPAATAPPLMAQAPPLILTQTAGGTFLLPAAPGTGNAPPILLTAQVQKTNTPSAGFTLPFCLLCSQTYRSSSCWSVIFSHCHYTDTQSS